MNPIMTIKTENSTFEVYAVNPGVNFSGFGGSKRGLLVGDTASMVVRHYCHESGSMHDSEHDIDCPRAWNFIKTVMTKSVSVE